MGVCTSNLCIPVVLSKFNHDPDIKKNPERKTIPKPAQYIVIEQDDRGRIEISETVVANSDQDISEFYTISETDILGSGISGSVKVCTHKKNNIKYALKTLPKVNPIDPTLDDLNKRLIRDLRNEIKIMSELDHPNILRIQEWFETENQIYVILDLCTGGDLLTRIEKSFSTFSESKICSYVRMMLSAIKYCHDHQVVHRDIKLENFVFENESSESPLKLIDFGFSRHFRKSELMSRSVGTCYYVAPEVVDGEYDNKCDIWSLGVVTYVLFTGCPPFNGVDTQEIIYKAKYIEIDYKARYFAQYSQEAQDFIQKCLLKDRNLRISATEAQKHPWFAKFVHTNSSSSTTSTSTSSSTSLPFESIGLSSDTSTSTKSNNMCSSLSSDVDMNISLSSNNLYTSSLSSNRVSYTSSNTSAIPINTISITVLENLKQFSDRNRLAQLCMEVVAYSLSSEQILHLQEEFFKFDIDHSGEISYINMRSLLCENGQFSDTEIQSIFRSMTWDRNINDGYVRYHEFLAAAINIRDVTEGNVRMAFEKLARHKDFLTRKEIYSLLSQDMTEAEFAAVLDSNLVQDHERITYIDFKRIVLGSGGPDPLTRSKSIRTKRRGSFDVRRRLQSLPIMLTSDMTSQEAQVFSSKLPAAQKLSDSDKDYRQTHRSSLSMTELGRHGSCDELVARDGLLGPKSSEGTCTDSVCLTSSGASDTTTVTDLSTVSIDHL